MSKVKWNICFQSITSTSFASFACHLAQVSIIMTMLTINDPGMYVKAQVCTSAHVSIIARQYAAYVDYVNINQGHSDHHQTCSVALKSIQYKVLKKTWSGIHRGLDTQGITVQLNSSPTGYQTFLSSADNQLFRKILSFHQCQFGSRSGLMLGHNCFQRLSADDNSR